MGPGTITQWMFICNCQAKLIQDSIAEEIDTCEKCGKTKRTNRAGTLTQWIFKPDFCDCDSEILSNSTDLYSNLKAHQVHTEEIKKPDSILAESYIDVSPELLPGDRYKVIETLGEGGTGTVFKARDITLNKLVAVKSLKVFSDEQAVAFQLEAKALSRLNHPNIVKIIDFGITNLEKPYMVMELFQGYSLENHIEKYGALPLESAIELIKVVCKAVGHAHSCEIYHRDIKPSNILISITGETISKVLLIDFGVAAQSKIKNPEDSQGKTIVGTPAYMSPDQAEGFVYDPRSEVYSIGVVLYECLTGKVPFVGETSLETINQHATAEPPSLSQMNADISYDDSIEALVSKCLEKRPEDRFQSVEDLSLALEEAAQSINLKSKATKQTSIKSKNSSKSIILLSSIALVAVASLLFFFSTSMKNDSKEKKATKVVKKYPLLSKSKIEERPKFVESKSHPFVAFNASKDVTDDDIIELSKNKTIYGLDLDSSKVKGLKLDILKSEPIQYINFSNTDLDDKAFKTMVELTSLKILRFERIPLNDEKIDAICTLKDLRILDLEDTDLTDSQLEKVCGLKNLQDLDIQSNHKITQKGFLNIIRCKSLWNVYLSDTSITRETLEKILDKNKSIKSVWMFTGKNFSGPVIESLSRKYPNCQFKGSTILEELGSVLYESPKSKKK